MDSSKTVPLEPSRDLLAKAAVVVRFSRKPRSAPLAVAKRRASKADVAGMATSTKAECQRLPTIHLEAWNWKKAPFRRIPFPRIQRNLATTIRRTFKLRMQLRLRQPGIV